MTRRTEGVLAVLLLTAAGCAAGTVAQARHLDSLASRLWAYTHITGRQAYERIGRPNRIVRKRLAYPDPRESGLQQLADEVWIYDGRRLGGEPGTIAHLYLDDGVVAYAKATLAAR
jgi:hypothetical protein